MKFTTPVSMPVTEAQYLELKPLLEAMGYEVRDVFGNRRTHINTNATDIDSIVEYGSDACKYGQILLPTYHRDLFLALAAMTDEPNGIAGEWWKYLGEDAPFEFTKGKLYEQDNSNPMQKEISFIDDALSINGFGGNNKNVFTKATVAEIFAHFGVSYGKEQAEPIQPEMPQPVPLIPQGCTFREWQRTLLAGCIVQGMIANAAGADITFAVQMTDKLITELDKTK